MIRLIRPSKPQKLLENEVALTNEYKFDKTKSVWKKTYIQTPLLEMTKNKCCYCERLIGRKSGQDVHIDHFKYKDKHPELVVDWNNLLPSCARCNRNKGTHDTEIEPIINPTEVDPKEFLYIDKYRFCSKDSKEGSLGRRTIGVFLLNDSDECCIVRFQLGTKLAEKLEELFQDAVDKGDDLKTDTVTKNKVINGCLKLLKQCIPSAEYSAFMATSLHTDSNFISLKELLTRQCLWNEDLEKLYEESKKSVYDTHR